MILIEVVFDDANELDPDAQVLQLLVLQEVNGDLTLDILTVLEDHDTIIQFDFGTSVIFLLTMKTGALYV